MKAILKIVPLTAAALGLGAVPASAHSISSPALGGTVNMVSPSQVTFSIFSGPPTICSVTMAGSVTVVGQPSASDPTDLNPGVVTFTSGTATGPGCPGIGVIVFPMKAKTINPTTLIVDVFKVMSPVGGCSATNLTLNYNNSTGVATLPPTVMGICTISATFQTGSNSLVIAP